MQADCAFVNTFEIAFRFGRMVSSSTQVIENVVKHSRMDFRNITMGEFRIFKREMTECGKGLLV